MQKQEENQDSQKHKFIEFKRKGLKSNIDFTSDGIGLINQFLTYLQANNEKLFNYWHFYFSIHLRNSGLTTFSFSEKIAKKTAAEFDNFLDAFKNWWENPNDDSEKKVETALLEIEKTGTQGSLAQAGLIGCVLLAIGFIVSFFCLPIGMALLASGAGLLGIAGCGLEITQDSKDNEYEGVFTSEGKNKTPRALTFFSHSETVKLEESEKSEKKGGCSSNCVTS